MNYKEITNSLTAAVIEPCRLVGMVVTTDAAGSSNSVVTLYDNASAASGDKIITVKVRDINDSKPVYFGGVGVRIKNGIYASLSGTVLPLVTLYYR